MTSSYRPHPLRVERALLDLWMACREDWRFVSERLSKAFRARKELHSAERRYVAECLYGMVRRYRTLEFACSLLGLPVHSKGEPVTRDRALTEWLVYRLLFEDFSPEEAKGFQEGQDWARVPETFQKIDALSSPMRRFALQHSLPDWIVSRIFKTEGLDKDAFAASLNERAPLTLRTNLLKGSREELLEQLQEESLSLGEVQKTAHSQTALRIEKHINVFGLKAYKAGRFEVQDEGSQLISELVAPSSGQFVVDTCAGGGGKTLALSALMKNRGRLLAMDISPHKLDELKKRARQGGLSNHETRVLPKEGPWPEEMKEFEGKAARVLVDAPCSGVGSLRRHPEARWRLDEAFVAGLPELQFEIASRALQLVKPGGRLIYATCTIFREENEAIVERLRELEPRLEPILVKEILGKARSEGIVSEDGHALKTYPHIHGMDGFFAMALRLTT